MRIERLDLIAFGPFTGTTLDFGDGIGFHVVYGLNEAGKTSALRAVGDMLFGFGQTTRDDFLHDQTNLRVGAVLSGGDERIDIVRRKGRVNTLLDRAGAPLDEAALTRLLGPVDRTTFNTAFGLSHRMLLEGGRDLLSDRGALGQALFGAGLGTAGVGDLLKTLEAEADALFRPRGQVQKVNVALRELGDARQRGRELALKPTAWKEHDDALREALAERAAITERLAASRTEAARLERLQKVLPLVANRDHLGRERATLEIEKPLPAESTARRERALADAAAAVDAQKLARDQLAAREDERAALAVPEEIVTRAQEIARLQQGVGAYVKAGDDLPRIQRELETAEGSARGLATALFPETKLEDLAERRPHPATPARVSELAGAFGGLEERVTAAKLALAETRTEFQRERDKLAAMPEPQPEPALAATIAAARAAGDVATRLQESQRLLAEAEERALVGVAALGLRSGTLSEIEALQVPIQATVDRFERDLSAVHERRRSTASTVVEINGRLTDTAHRLTEIEAAGELPSDEALTHARTKRQRGWRLVRSAWLDEDAGDDDAAGFASEQPLDRAYEEAVAEADRIADVRHREASRLAEIASLNAATAAHKEALEAAEPEANEAETAVGQLLDDWGSVWAVAGIEPLPPAEMRGWLMRHAALVVTAAERRARLTEVQREEQTIERHRSALAEALLEAGVPVAREDESLSTRLERAQHTLETLEDTRRTHGALVERVEKLVKQETTDSARLELANAELAGWRDEWQPAASALGLDGSVSPTQAQATVSELTRLFGLIDAAAELRRRIDGMRRDRAAFENDAAVLGTALAPELEGVQPELAVPQLAARATAAAADAATAEQLEQRIAEQRAALDKAHVEEVDADERLAELVIEGGCADILELQELERGSALARDLDQQIENIEREVVAAGERPLAEIETEAAAISGDEIASLLPAANEEVEEFEGQLRGISERIGTEQEVLRRMDGSGQAGEAAEEAQEALARVRRYAEDHARFRIAALLLRHAIERYRTETQGPLVTRVSELFPRLTIESFDGVTVDFDKSDLPVLVGTRDGKNVPVEGMSDGARDQLYLALRIASLERLVDTNNSLPLIADDLFLNFDDERARAGLKILATLAERMQVIFFTHHRHLVDIARDAIPAGAVHIHELADPASAPTS